jgi:signal transduction histidine kinase
MSRLFGTSIQQKMTSLMLVVSGIALLLASSAFIVNDFFSFRENMVYDLTSLAQIIGENSTSALVFNDSQSAEDTLSSLRAKKHINTVVLFTKEGASFARFLRGAKDDFFSPIKPAASGYRFEENTFLLFHDIILDGEKIGSLLIRADLDEFYSRLRRSGGMAIAVMIVSIGVVFFLSMRLQRTISGPILYLSMITKTVSEEKNYTIRAKGEERQDEFGILFTGFNEMLSQIQNRDNKLREYQEHLEEQVSVRTVLLTQMNTELTTTRDTALEATRIKSAFLATMSHELRTPLNAIIGYSELLIEAAETENQKQLIPDLEKIRSAGKHLLEMINEIMDISKIEAGKMTLYLEPFDLYTMAKEIENLIQPLVSKKEVRFILDCPEKIGSMHADLTKVRQTVLNLLSNACKFTEKGTITFKIDRGMCDGKESIFLMVSDTGIGMTPEQMGNLFQSFSQADSSTTRKYGGTGLGLAISKRFCQMMGGDLTVTSEFGKSATFTVTLPVLATETESANAQAQEAIVNITR